MTSSLFHNLTKELQNLVFGNSALNVTLTANRNLQKKCFTVYIDSWVKYFRKLIFLCRISEREEGKSWKGTQPSGYIHISLASMIGQCQEMKATRTFAINSLSNTHIFARFREKYNLTKVLVPEKKSSCNANLTSDPVYFFVV